MDSMLERELASNSPAYVVGKRMVGKIRDAMKKSGFTTAILYNDDLLVSTVTAVEGE
jgi:hypothetical protein